MATGGAESNLVALARTVARNHCLGAVDQRVAVIIRGTAALSYVIDDATARAFSARFTAFART